MRKEKIMKRKKKIVLFEIMNLVVAVFAFTFLISLSNEVEVVSGADGVIRPVSGGYNYGGKVYPSMTDALKARTLAENPIIESTNIAPTADVASEAAKKAAADLVAQQAAQQKILDAFNAPSVSWAKAGTGKVGGELYNLESATIDGVTRFRTPGYDGYFQKAADGTLTKVGSGGAGTQAGTGGVMDGINALKANTLLSGLFWAATISGLVYMAAGMFGASKNTQKALFMASFAGILSWNYLSPLATGGAGWDMTLFGGVKNLGAGALGISPGGVFLISVGIAAAVFIMLYKKTSSEIVTFDCKPYEAPVGGNYCELCNKDKLRPCSEYRCRSLGQACKLLNEGTGKEACAWVNPKDVTSPTISPWTDVLLKGYSYKDVKTRPPGTGMRVVRDSASDGCVKAFTPLSFGINTNEPTQCKIDYNHTVNVRDVKNAYDSMAFYFGESSIYDYNHSQTMRLPGPAALAAQNISPEISLDGTYTLYVRCQDANGNINEDEFAIRFCVEKGPDTTPPVIEGTSIPSGMPVAFNTNDTDIEVYVNEPADCKWSKQDKDYELMENTMTCDRNVYDINTNMLYKCFGKLTGLENRKDNEFYFRCKDQPYLENENDRFTNTESYKFIIKGSQPLNIKANSIKPNGTVQGFADVVTVDLTLETENGYNKGDAICYFSASSVDSTFIKMFETGTNKHKQNQQLTSGTYTYYFKCIDLGGNADYNQTSFSVQVDRIAPQIARVYNEGSNLKIETDEKSTCYYSENNNNKCNYELKDGKQMLYQNVTAHYIEWKTNNNLYVKCVDVSGNQPNPVDCSIIVRPYNSK